MSLTNHYLHDAMKEQGAIGTFQQEMKFCSISELFRLRDCLDLILKIVNTGILKRFLEIVKGEIEERFKGR